MNPHGPPLWLKSSLEYVAPRKLGGISARRFLVMLDVTHNDGSY